VPEARTERLWCFTKKIAFRVATILGEFNGKICSEWPQNASPTIWNFKIFRGKTLVSWFSQESLFSFNQKYITGFSKRIEVGVSIYKVGGDLSARGTNRAPQAQVGESSRGGFAPSLVGGGVTGVLPRRILK
jgi:hypothetical protein